MENQEPIGLSADVSVPEQTPTKKEPSAWWEIVKFVFLTLIIVLPIRAYIAQPFIVQGASMEPTFDNGEYLIVDELSYLLREPKRGEVVVFRYPRSPKIHFIKRIIGLPGETVVLKNRQVEIIDKNGQIIKLQEPYVAKQSFGNSRIALGTDEYFVMGDNRTQSSDSRSWGPVEKKLMRGRALLRLFPFSEISYKPGDYSSVNN